MPEKSDTLPVVVMGVAGSGKTVVGSALAEALGVAFIEGDQLHPPENVARMASGLALRDEDRVGWLEAVGKKIVASAPNGAVAACSALKRRYRDQLRRHYPSLLFLHLAIDRETAYRRVGERKGHFMPASLVESQFATLELLAADEAGLTLDGTRPVEELVAASIAFLKREGWRRSEHRA